jgi:hypothetical protein
VEGGSGGGNDKGSPKGLAGGSENERVLVKGGATPAEGSGGGAKPAEGPGGSTKPAEGPAEVVKGLMKVEEGRGGGEGGRGGGGFVDLNPAQFKLATDSSCCSRC